MVDVSNSKLRQLKDVMVVDIHVAGVVKQILGLQACFEDLNKLLAGVGFPFDGLGDRFKLLFESEHIFLSDDDQLHQLCVFHQFLEELVQLVDEGTCLLEMAEVIKNEQERLLSDCLFSEP